MTKRKGYTDRQRIIDYRATFGSDHGQRVLNDMMARFHMFGSVVRANVDRVDPLEIAFRDGERNAVLTILEFMGMKPAEIPQARESVLRQFGLEEETEPLMAQL